MTITLRYFAALREAVGLSQESVPLPEGVQTVGALRDWLVQRGAPWTEALGARRAVRAAHNQRLCTLEQRIADGDEVAFFPPVTGG